MARRERSSGRSRDGDDGRGERQIRTRRSDKKEAKRHAESGGSRFARLLKGEFLEFKPKAGNHWFRIMPITENAPEYQRHWALPVYIHYTIGPDDSAFLCPRKSLSLNNPCPICDEMLQAQKEGDSAYASDLRPGAKWICWVIDRNAQDEGPKIFFMPDLLESNICGLLENPRTGEMLDIDHELDGYDITFIRQGSTKQNTKYKSAAIDRDPTPLSDDEKEMEEWLEYIDKHPLDSVLNFYDEKYLEQMFAGTAPRSNDDEGKEDEDRGRGRSSRQPRYDSEGEEDENPPRSRFHGRRGSRQEGEKEIDDENAPLDDPGEEDSEPRSGRGFRGGSTTPSTERSPRTTSRSDVRSRVRERLSGDE